MFGRLTHILTKEFIQLWRDKWGRFRLIVPPVIQLLLFGYAATFEVYHVSTAVLDLDHTQESRELIAGFTSSTRFDIVRVAQSQQEADAAIDRSDAAVALVIHAGFANLLRKGQAAPLQVVVDGTNSNTALIALGYVNTIAAQFSANYITDLAERTRGVEGSELVQVEVVQRPWFNPDLNGRWFFVPGLIATITLVMLVNLTAFAVVREREVGTLEQIMVSPIRPAEFILGKTVPFFVVGLGIAGLISIVGILWFQVPFVGNPLVFAFGTMLYLLSLLAIGLLISTVCSTQQQAFATNFFVVNPLFTLSGFSFPISSMPNVLQWLSYINPLRYYLIVIRGTFLKGVGVTILWPEFLAMAIIAAVLMTFSILRFRKSLE
ncbi:ABC transporter permease [Bradyrhizobium sp. dw_78]|uniref:ABC transporter permease n=1 Tax=Bradyrhizobium sp. dw_78 TaxID=2719793 RepID=UPI001BD247BB|nr:ABC transporter permease [Bradyrhizobium sp. dw_78]